jgi:hypothetical protein
MVTLHLRAIPSGSTNPSQYLVDLHLGDYAVLTRVSSNVWDAKVFTPDGPPIERGAFASPEAALAAFQSEVMPRLTANTQAVAAKKI